MDRDAFSAEKLDEIRREFSTLTFDYEDDVLSVSHPNEIDLLSLVITNDGCFGYLWIAGLEHYIEGPTLCAVRQFLYGIETIVLFRAEVPVAWRQLKPEEQISEWLLQTKFGQDDPYDYQTFGDEVYTKAIVRISWSGGNPGEGEPKIVTTDHELVGDAPAKSTRQILENIKPFEWSFDAEIEDGHGNRWVPLGQSKFEVLLPIDWRLNTDCGYYLGSLLSSIPYDTCVTNQTVEFMVWTFSPTAKYPPEGIYELETEHWKEASRRINSWRMVKQEGDHFIYLEVKLYSKESDNEHAADFLRANLPLIRLRIVE